MNFKIIRIPETTTDICLHRGRSEQGDEVVYLSAFVLNAQQAELMFEQVVTFSTRGSAVRFVSDCSLRSARSFLQEMMAEAGLVAFA